MQTLLGCDFAKTWKNKTSWQSLLQTPFWKCALRQYKASVLSWICVPFIAFSIMCTLKYFWENKVKERKVKKVKMLKYFGSRLLAGESICSSQFSK